MSIIEIINHCHATQYRFFNWKLISELKLPNKFIQKFTNYLDWSILSKHQYIDLEFIDIFSQNIDYDILPENKYLTEIVIKKIIHLINFNKLKIFNKRISKKLSEFYQKEINPEILLITKKMSEEDIILRINPYILDIIKIKELCNIIFNYQNISENFILRLLSILNISDINFFNISLILKNQTLSCNFITHNIDLNNYENLILICEYQKINDNFIENNIFSLLTKNDQFKNVKILINKILFHQIMSEELIIKLVIPYIIDVYSEDNDNTSLKLFFKYQLFGKNIYNIIIKYLSPSHSEENMLIKNLNDIILIRHESAILPKLNWPETDLNFFLFKL